MAYSDVALATALVPHHPPPAPPCAPQEACALAWLPPAADCASLLAEKLCRQVAPLLASQAAET